MHSLLALLFDLIIQLLSVSELSHLRQPAYYKAFGQWEETNVLSLDSFLRVFGNQDTGAVFQNWLVGESQSKNRLIYWYWQLQAVKE